MFPYLAFDADEALVAEDPEADCETEEDPVVLAVVVPLRSEDGIEESGTEGTEAESEEMVDREAVVSLADNAVPPLNEEDPGMSGGGAEATALDDNAEPETADKETMLDVRPDAFVDNDGALTLTADDAGSDTAGALEPARLYQRHRRFRPSTRPMSHCAPTRGMKGCVCRKRGQWSGTGYARGGDTSEARETQAGMASEGEVPYIRIQATRLQW